jgi:Fur family ferric uptake transcriptional regulator
MKQYATAQRKLMISFLSAHAAQVFSAAELAKNMDAGGISLSAVYRNLARLAGEGRVRKLLSDDGRTFMYQHRDPAVCDAHLHLKCTKCGKIFHMDDAASQSVLDAARENDAFLIDKTQTILYGLCDVCRKRG